MLKKKEPKPRKEPKLLRGLDYRMVQRRQVSMIYRPCNACNGTGAVSTLDGGRLRFERKRLGVSSLALARHMKISKSLLYAIETMARHVTELRAQRYLMALDTLVALAALAASAEAKQKEKV